MVGRWTVMLEQIIEESAKMQTYEENFISLHIKSASASIRSLEYSTLSGGSLETARLKKLSKCVKKIR